MQHTTTCKVGFNMSHLLFIDVGLLDENHHKMNLIAGESLLLNEGDILLL